MTLEQTLLSERILPVIVLEDAGRSRDLASVLLEAGIHSMEITLRTPAALDAISAAAEVSDTLHLGAGTILSIDDCKRAVDAGASYIITPGFNELVVEYALAQGITIFPGVCTPSEIDRARNLGVDTLKFFPAEPAGGATFLKAICAPYRHVRFIPTGGIKAETLADYLDIPNVIACGASWFVEKQLIADADWKTVTERAKTLLSITAQHPAKQ